MQHRLHAAIDIADLQRAAVQLHHFLDKVEAQALPQAGVPGGLDVPAIGRLPAWLTHIGEPPTKPWGPWSKLSALKSS